jgi:hypothetical protein
LVPVLEIAATKWNFTNNLAHKVYDGGTIDQEIVAVQGLPYAPIPLIFIHSFIMGDCHSGRIHGKGGCMFHVYHVFSTFHIEKPIALLSFSNVNE